MTGGEVLWAIPAVPIVGSLILRDARRVVYWSAALVLTVAASAPVWTMPRDPYPPANSPFALAAFFVVLPTAATFAIERLWFLLGRPHPFLTLILAVPLGLIAYAFSTLMALTLAVNAGALRP